MNIQHDGLAFFCILLSCAGQVIHTIGFLLWKRASIVESEKPFYLRLYFWLGFALICLDSCVIGIFVYAYTPMSLTAPVMALSVVVSFVFAGFGVIVEKENVPLSAVAASCVIIIGIVVAGFFGSKDTTSPTIAQMKQSVTQFRNLVFLTISACIVISFFVVKSIMETGTAKVVWGSLSAALCGAIGSMGMKGASVCLRVALTDDENQFMYIGVYLLLLGCLCLGLTNVYLLNEAIENSPVTYGIPLYVSIDVVITIIAGAVAYGDFDNIRRIDIVCFALGIAATILGLFWLSYVKAEEIEHKAKFVESPRQGYGSNDKDKQTTASPASA